MALWIRNFIDITFFQKSNEKNWEHFPCCKRLTVKREIIVNFPFFVLKYRKGFVRSSVLWLFIWYESNKIKCCKRIRYDSAVLSYGQRPEKTRVLLVITAVKKMGFAYRTKIYTINLDIRAEWYHCKAMVISLKKICAMWRPKS